MWPLTNGNRCLVGPEAELFRGTVAMMVDQLVDELNVAGEVDQPVEPDDSNEALFSLSGPVVGFDPPHWYDMWEPEQKIWLLERVATSLLTSRPAPAMAAMFEATVEAVYVEVPDTEWPTYEGRAVVLGPRAGDFYIVREGLSRGERV
ncbi:MAG: hypothetical protein ACF787_05765, partial [Rhodopirellula sp. JB053]